MQIAYQGEPGAFSEAAAQQIHADAQLMPCRAFEDVFTAVEDGTAGYGVLPIENSIGGSIHRNFDLLLQHDLPIIAELEQPVVHHLLALPGSTLESIRRVYSHPQALAQCSTFLSALENCRVEMEEDTASAARSVAESGDLSRGAIASKEAATRYGLQVLKRNVANQREVFTRFVVIARKPMTADPRLPHKTSLLVTIAHSKGALARGLDALASHGVNLTKLESRPRIGRPFEYQFYVDFEGNVADANVQRALDEMTGLTRALKIFGSYPARKIS